MDSCCRTCQRRHAGRHNQCADYATYKAELEAHKTKVGKARGKERMMSEYDVALSRRVRGARA